MPLWITAAKRSTSNVREHIFGSCVLISYVPTKDLFLYTGLDPPNLLQKWSDLGVKRFLQTTLVKQPRYNGKEELSGMCVTIFVIPFRRGLKKKRWRSFTVGRS